MKQIFTPNDLLRFIYKEMGEEEENAIQNQLKTNRDLSQEFRILLDGILILDQGEMTPNSSLIEELKGKLLNRQESSK
jgi:hypothetical protein